MFVCVCMCVVCVRVVFSLAPKVSWGSGNFSATLCRVSNLLVPEGFRMQVSVGKYLCIYIFVCIRIVSVKVVCICVCVLCALVQYFV